MGGLDMWSRAYLKDRAKKVLKVSYWKAFLVSLVIAIVGGRQGGASFNFNWNFGGGRNSAFSSTGSFTGADSEIIPVAVVFIIIMVIVALFAFLFFLSLRVFLGYPLEVGGRRYFVQSAQSNFDLNNLGYAFHKDKYFDIVKTMFWRGLLNFLWFLLLIIPGVIKMYAYSMVPYILADNPNIGYKRAVELSERMTYGHKFSMWVLDLSFIGWYLLGALALFIGILFVMPYENATKGELYLVLRQNALDSGLCTPEELKL